MKSSSRTEIILTVVLVVVALIINVIGTHNAKTEPYPGSNDFYSRWSAVRDFWLKGLNPYGEEASLNIQIGIYGRPVVPGEDPGYFAYPFYTIFLMAPLGLLDYAWAEAIWLVVLEMALLGAMILLMDLFRWRPPRWLWALTLAWTLFFYPAARGLLLGQPGLVVYFLEVLALWAIARRRDGLAGAALALSTIKPQMGFLLVPALLLWALWERRWQIAGWFAGVWGGLMVLSFLVQPNWMAEWLAQVALYPSYTDIGSPLWVLTRGYLPFLGAAGETVITIILLLLVVWAWFQQFRHGQDFGWAVSLTLAVTHIVAVRTASPHFIVFTIPLVFYFRVLTHTAPKRAPWAIVLVQVVLLVGPWYHFLATVGWLGPGDKTEHPVTYMFLPYMTLFVLLLTRKLWQEHATAFESRIDRSRHTA